MLLLSPSTSPTSSIARASESSFRPHIFAVVVLFSFTGGPLLVGKLLVDNVHRLHRLDVPRLPLAAPQSSYFRHLGSPRPSYMRFNDHGSAGVPDADNDVMWDVRGWPGFNPNLPAAVKARMRPSDPPRPQRRTGRARRRGAWGLHHRPVVRRGGGGSGRADGRPRQSQGPGHATASTVSLGVSRSALEQRRPARTGALGPTLNRGCDAARGYWRPTRSPIWRRW